MDRVQLYIGHTTDDELFERMKRMTQEADIDCELMRSSLPPEITTRRGFDVYLTWEKGTYRFVNEKAKLIGGLKKIMKGRTA